MDFRSSFSMSDRQAAAAASFFSQPSSLSLSPISASAFAPPASPQISRHSFLSGYPSASMETPPTAATGGSGGSPTSTRLQYAYRGPTAGEAAAAAAVASYGRPSAMARAPPMRRVRPKISARLSAGVSPQSAYRRKRFLVFIKVLLKCLRRDTHGGAQLYQQAKAIIADCTRRNRYKDPQYCPLPEAVERRLRPLVGEAQWKRANACLDLYLEKRRQLAAATAAAQRYAAYPSSYRTPSTATAAVYGSTYGAYGSAAPPPTTYVVDRLDVLPEIQNQHRARAVGV